MRILRSRKFWLTLVGVGGVIAGQYYGVDDTTIKTVSNLVMALVGAIAVEDAAKKIITK